MPRRRTLPQDCIVCFEDPCTCIKKPEKAKRPPRQRTPEPETRPEQEQVVVAPKPSDTNAMKKAAQAAELDRRKTEPLAAQCRTNLSDDDALMVDAVRLLNDTFGPIDGPDIEKYRPYLNRPATPGERAAAWRARRRGA